MIRLEHTEQILWSTNAVSTIGTTMFELEFTIVVISGYSCKLRTGDIGKPCGTALCCCKGVECVDCDVIDPI